jgi:predicted DNA-binding protein
MAKLTETIHAIKVSKELKHKLVQISEDTNLPLQYIYRIFLEKGVENYLKNIDTDSSFMDI